MSMVFRAASLAVLTLVATATAEEARSQKRLSWTTESETAWAGLMELQTRVERFQHTPDSTELARQIVAADPEFAMGAYYLSAVVMPPENQQYLDRAVELADQASSGERRFIRAMVLARSRAPEDALEPLEELAEEYPEERPIQMILGQLYAATNDFDRAEVAYERAMSLDASTPRAPAFLGNCYLLSGDYARARELFEASLAKAPSGAIPYAARYGLAFAHLYEGDPKAAIASLEAYLAEYRLAGAGEQYPEVFIWHSIARIQLEQGQLEQAMASYEKGYQTVADSSLSDDEKQLWLGRLVHGRGRALARMGKHEEAQEAVETVRAMIAQGGEEAEEHLPAYHYLAGYVSLEAGRNSEAIEHLEQANQKDPFQKLLLARAYERAGQSDQAKAAYSAVLEATDNTLDRALAYPEARRELAK